MKRKKYKKIPLRLNSIGHLEVEVVIDKTRTTFLVDTGASNTVIDIGFAREKLFEFSAIGEQGGGVGTSSMELFHKKVRRLSLDDFSIRDFDLFATDFSHVKDSLAKKGITEIVDGVIGADILMRYNAIIDYRKMAMYLREKKK